MVYTKKLAGTLHIGGMQAKSSVHRAMSGLRCRASAIELQEKLKSTADNSILED